MPFEIPTQIELSSTNLLIAGGVLHFLVASFMHFKWLKEVKKLVKQHNETPCNTVVAMDNFGAVCKGIFRYLIGPEWKIIENGVYIMIRIVGSVLTMSNYKPWKLALYKVKDDDIILTNLRSESSVVGPSV